MTQVFLTRSAAFSLRLLLRCPRGRRFSGRGLLRRRLTGARRHADLFQRLFLAAQRRLGDLHILCHPVIHRGQRRILKRSCVACCARTFPPFLRLIGLIVGFNLGALSRQSVSVVAKVGQ